MLRQPARATAGTSECRHCQRLAIAAILMGMLLGCKGGGVSTQGSSGGCVAPQLAAAPAEPQTTSQRSLTTQMSLARMLEQQGDLEQAAALYRGLLQNHPHHAVAVHRLAIVYDRQGRFAESAELFKQALRLRPHDADAACDLAYSLYLQQRWDEAEERFRQALAVDAAHQRTHNLLGLLLAQTGRRDEAFSEFEKAGCTAGQSHLNLAFALAMNENLAEAREEYELALAAGASSPESGSRLQFLERQLSEVPLPPQFDRTIKPAAGETDKSNDRVQPL